MSASGVCETYGEDARVGTSFRGRRVLVAGAAVTGRSAAEALLEAGAVVTVTDGSEQRLAELEPLRAQGVELVAGLAAPPEDVDLVVTSPGWRPESELLSAAAASGVEVIGEVELAWRLDQRRERPARWLVVTGTNGKTTAVGMLESILRAAGVDAVACGNVGLPVVIPLVALMAACAAVVSAEQADAFPGPGAPYACVRSKLGILPARISVSTHFVGSVAAMAALARSVESYLAPAVPSGFAAVVILLAVLASTAGLRIRGGAAWLWLGLVLVVLGVVVATCLAVAPPGSASGAAVGGDRAVGITGAAGVLFFAFLGFERLTAPASERDRHERRSVRVGVRVSCVAVTGLLVLAGFALLRQLGPARLALSPAPVRDALAAAAAADLGPLVGTAVAVVMLPALLAVLETARSTPLAAVRDGELPRSLGRTSGSGTPFVLDVVLGGLAAGLGFLVSPAQAMALASCCLLVHYALAGAAGRVLLVRGPRWLRWSSCLGMGLAVVLAMSMPLVALVETAAVVFGGPVAAWGMSRLRR